MKTYTTGSNQHKRHTTYDLTAEWFIFWSLFILAVIGGFIISKVFYAVEDGKLKSPIPLNYAGTAVRAQERIQPTSTPTPSLPPDKQNIAEEIRQVFGEHADKAFQVLSCENARLNPDAVNTAGNSPAGSRDIGIFQINEYWQKVNAKFLFEPTINIRIAYKIFKDSGYSFRMWSCGQRLGI